jgi:hypothetical protein
VRDLKRGQSPYGESPKRPFARIALAAAIGLLGVSALAAISSPAFPELKWTTHGSEYEALASAPVVDMVFLNPGSFTPDDARQRAGEALFNTPTLLGGQAAKAGLSCASCHINGRDNPHFFLTGVSDKPGTADVTSSFFSTARSNGRFDPVQIPDLAAPGKIAREAEKAELEPFIRTLIVDEFGGNEPSTATLQALAAYVRALRMPASYRQKRFQRSPLDQTQLVKYGADAALWMIGQKDRPGTLLALAAMRHQLELLHERYAGAALRGERQALLDASRELRRIGEIEQWSAMETALGKWSNSFGKIEARLLQKAGQSLYDADRLAAVLNVPVKAYPIP